MRLNDGLHSLREQQSVGILGETHQRGNVIQGGLGLFHALHINAHLCIGQGYVA